MAGNVFAVRKLHVSEMVKKKSGHSQVILLIDFQSTKALATYGLARVGMALQKYLAL